MTSLMEEEFQVRFDQKGYVMVSKRLDLVPNIDPEEGKRNGIRRRKRNAERRNTYIWRRKTEYEKCGIPPQYLIMSHRWLPTVRHLFFCLTWTHSDLVLPDVVCLRTLSVNNSIHCIQERASSVCEHDLACCYKLARMLHGPWDTVKIGHGHFHRVHGFVSFVAIRLI